MVAILILNIVLFFLPWFSVDGIDYKNVTGISYSGLVDKLEESFVDFSFINIGILLYLVPILSGFAIVLLLTNSKIKVIVSNISFFSVAALLVVAYKAIDFLCNMVNSTIGYNIYNIDVSAILWIYAFIQIVGIVLVIVLNQISDVENEAKATNKNKTLINIVLTVTVIIAIVFIGILIGDLEGYFPWFFSGETYITFFIRDTLITLGGIIMTIGLFMVVLKKASNEKKRSDLLNFNIISTLIYVASIYFQGISIMFVFSTVLIISIWAIWLFVNANKKQIDTDNNL